MWMKNQLEGDCETMVNNNEFSQLSCGGRSHGLPITRILPSEAIGVILLGSLKVSKMNILFTHIIITTATELQLLNYSYYYY